MRSRTLALPIAAIAAGAAIWIALDRGDGQLQDRSLVPTPIGRGPAFLPSPDGFLAVNRRLPCRRGSLVGRYRAHVELFADGKVVIVPAGVGVAPPRRVVLGKVVAGRCRFPLRTLDPTGVVELDREGLTLADLFVVWRMPLGDRHLLSFAGTPVTAFVNGSAYKGEPRSIPLHDRDEIVLEINGYVPPHRSYLFAPRS